MLADLIHQSCYFPELTKGVQLGFAFRESFRISGVYQEYDSIDFREIISPQSSSCWSPDQRPFASYYEARQRKTYPVDGHPNHMS